MHNSQLPGKEKIDIRWKSQAQTFQELHKADAYKLYTFWVQAHVCMWLWGIDGEILEYNPPELSKVKQAFSYYVISPAIFISFPGSVLCQVAQAGVKLKILLSESPNQTSL